MDFSTITFENIGEQKDHIIALFLENRKKVSNNVYFSAERIASDRGLTVEDIKKLISIEAHNTSTAIPLKTKSEDSKENNISNDKVQHEFEIKNKLVYIYDINNSKKINETILFQLVDEIVLQKPYESNSNQNRNAIINQIKNLKTSISIDHNPLYALNVLTKIGFTEIDSLNIISSIYHKKVRNSKIKLKSSSNTGMSVGREIFTIIKIIILIVALVRLFAR